MNMAFWVFSGIAALFLIGALLASRDTEIETKSLTETQVKDILANAIMETRSIMNEDKSGFNKNVIGLQKQISDLKEAISSFQTESENTSKHVQSMNKEIEILKIRQHTLDKKIAAKDKRMEICFSKESQPVPVNILPKGKGQDALLKKSGIKEKQ